MQEDFKKFASSLREVLNYIKYSKNENGLARLLAEDDRLKALEAFTKAADGKATKIIIPSEIQGMAGLATSLQEVWQTPSPKE